MAEQLGSSDCELSPEQLKADFINAVTKNLERDGVWPNPQEVEVSYLDRQQGYIVNLSIAYLDKKATRPRNINAALCKLSDAVEIWASGGQFVNGFNLYIVTSHNLAAQPLEFVLDDLPTLLMADVEALETAPSMSAEQIAKAIKILEELQGSDKVIDQHHGYTEQALAYHQQVNDQFVKLIDGAIDNYCSDEDNFKLVSIDKSTIVEITRTLNDFNEPIVYTVTLNSRQSDQIVATHYRLNKFKASKFSPLQKVEASFVNDQATLSTLYHIGLGSDAEGLAEERTQHFVEIYGGKPGTLVANNKSSNLEELLLGEPLVGEAHLKRIAAAMKPGGRVIEASEAISFMFPGLQA